MPFGVAAGLGAAALGATAGTAIAAGAVVGGAAISSRASSKASKQQEALAREGMGMEERMFERGLEETAPFREAGIGQLEAFQQGLTPQGRADSLQGFYDSAEFGGLESQAEQAILRNRSATGGLRSGGSQAALAGIAPQLGQNFLNSQAQNQLALINAGQGLAGQASNQANALGRSQLGSMQNIGAIQAGGTLAKSQAITGALGGVTGLLTGKGGII